MPTATLYFKQFNIELPTFCFNSTAQNKNPILYYLFCYKNYFRKKILKAHDSIFFCFEMWNSNELEKKLEWFEWESILSAQPKCVSVNRYVRNKSVRNVWQSKKRFGVFASSSTGCQSTANWSSIKFYRRTQPHALIQRPYSVSFISTSYMYTFFVQCLCMCARVYVFASIWHIRYIYTMFVLTG